MNVGGSRLSVPDQTKPLMLAASVGTGWSSRVPMRAS
jgi:hypothetical protein